jgi:tetratricopeptide (TPR) repeat protein
LILTTMRVLVIAIVVAVAAAAFAEPPENTEASRIFLQGRDLVKQGRYDEACELFARSYGLDPALGTAVNLADCLERQGHLRRAWALFDVVARNPQSVQSRAKLARERADALLGKLATVIITLRDPRAAGLVVRIGDRGVAPVAEIHDLIEPGDVELVATAPGHRAWKTTLHGVAGAPVTAEIPALAALPAAPAAPAAPGRRRSRVYLAAGLGAVGVLGLGSSLGLGIWAKRTYDGAFDHDCTHTPGGVVCMRNGAATIDRAGKRADLATGLALGGALFAVASAVVFLTAPTEAVQLAPVATPHTLGLGVVGRF